MSLIDMLFKRRNSSAIAAKERLQIILAHERNSTSNEPLWLSDLQQELMVTIGKYVNLPKDSLKVNCTRRGNLDLLEINITLPDDRQVVE